MRLTSYELVASQPSSDAAILGDLGDSEDGQTVVVVQFGLDHGGDPGEILASPEERLRLG
jgi:hypothetical protein